MLRSVLSKAARKEKESSEEEKETDQLEISLIEHCDVFHDKTYQNTKVN